MNITALMPLKKESERIPNKNIRLFNGKPLFYYVLETLNKSEYINEIIINTDCNLITDMIIKDFPQCIILHRPAELLGNHIIMNQLIEHDILHAKNEHILQTHCTNPLVAIHTIENAISCYLSSLDDYDSLFTVNKIQSRMYNEFGVPINHQFERMEMTQNMKPVLKKTLTCFSFLKQFFLKQKTGSD